MGRGWLAAFAAAGAAGAAVLGLVWRDLVLLETLLVGVTLVTAAAPARLIHLNRQPTGASYLLPLLLVLWSLGHVNEAARAAGDLPARAYTLSDSVFLLSSGLLLLVATPVMSHSAVFVARDAVTRIVLDSMLIGLGVGVV